MEGPVEPGNPVGPWIKMGPEQFPPGRGAGGGEIPLEGAGSIENNRAGPGVEGGAGGGDRARSGNGPDQEPIVHAVRAEDLVTGPFPEMAGDQRINMTVWCGRGSHPAESYRYLAVLSMVLCEASGYVYEMHSLLLDKNAVAPMRQDIEFYQREGYWVARGLFAPDEIDEIRETFMAQAADGPVEGLSDGSRTLGPADPLSRYPRMMHPHRRLDLPVGPLSLRTMLDRRLQAVLEALFGEEAIAAQSMFYFKPPGARGQALHQDNFYLRVHPGTCMAAWVAIDRADRENGGMVVVPGSGGMEVVCPEKADSTKFFTTEHIPVPEGKREVGVDLEPGDVLFFNGSLIHGSYPNTTTDRFRRSFICHYVPRSCVEVAHWYRPLLTFDGREVEKETARGGGPCGTVAETSAPH